MGLRFDHPASCGPGGGGGGPDPGIDTSYYVDEAQSGNRTGNAAENVTAFILGVNSAINDAAAAAAALALEATHRAGVTHIITQLELTRDCYTPNDGMHGLIRNRDYTAVDQWGTLWGTTDANGNGWRDPTVVIQEHVVGANLGEPTGLSHPGTTAPPGDPLYAGVFRDQFAGPSQELYQTFTVSSASQPEAITFIRDNLGVFTGDYGVIYIALGPSAVGIGVTYTNSAGKPISAWDYGNPSANTCGSNRNN